MCPFLEDRHHAGPGKQWKPGAVHRSSSGESEAAFGAFVGLPPMILYRCYSLIFNIYSHL